MATFEKLMEETLKNVLEEYGLTEDMSLKDCVEKQIAKKVNLYIGEVPSCPVCNTRLRGYEGFIIAYCKGCGQLLKGEGVNDD